VIGDELIVMGRQVAAGYLREARVDMVARS
jgi:hypothetical protein